MAEIMSHDAPAPTLHTATHSASVSTRQTQDLHLCPDCCSPCPAATAGLPGAQDTHRRPWLAHGTSDLLVLLVGSCLGKDCARAQLQNKYIVASRGSSMCAAHCTYPAGPTPSTSRTCTALPGHLQLLPLPAFVVGLAACHCSWLHLPYLMPWMLLGFCAAPGTAVSSAAQRWSARTARSSPILSTSATSMPSTGVYTRHTRLVTVRYRKVSLSRKA